MKEIYLAGGCFWGAEKYLSLIFGVTQTEVGYANGRTENPTYEQVCANSGHAEAVRVVYDPAQLSLSFLLEVFFQAIDPTSLNRQGGDVGVQYRTGVYYTDPEDREVILLALSRLREQYAKPVVIEAAPLKQFYPAEAYHQKYLVKNPTGYCHIGAMKFAFAGNAKDPHPQGL